MLLTKVLTTAAAAALTLGLATGVSYAGGQKAPSPSPSPSPTATATASSSDTATATIRVKAQNVTITALTFSDTATSTITVKDTKRGTAAVTWEVPQGTKMSGYYKRMKDLRPGFTVHLSGTQTGSAAPVADHVVAPGRNKKVATSGTVVAVDGARQTITVRDRKGATSTWSVRSAKVEGKAKRKGDLSRGDVVSLRGESVEGSGKGTASVVKVEKDVKPKKR